MTRDDDTVVIMGCKELHWSFRLIFESLISNRDINNYQMCNEDSN